MSVPPLPEGWKEELDEATGVHYYVHDESGKRSWVRPNFRPPGPGGGPPMMGGPPPNFRGPMGAPPPFQQAPPHFPGRPPQFAQPPPPMSGPPPPHPERRLVLRHLHLTLGLLQACLISRRHLRQM